VQTRLEGDLAAAQATVRDMQAALLAASDPLEPQLLDEAVTVAHSAWVRHPGLIRAKEPYSNDNLF